LYSDCVCHDDYDYYFDFLFPSLRVTHWQSSVNWSCHICWPKLFAVNWKTNEPKRDWRPSWHCSLLRLSCSADAVVWFIRVALTISSRNVVSFSDDHICRD
jgi:hypothetical protein